MRFFEYFSRPGKRRTPNEAAPHRDFGLHLRHALPCPSVQVGHLSWSPDGHTLAAILDGEIRLWNARSGELLRDWAHFPALNSYVLNWSPDSKMFTTASRSRSLIVDADSGTLLEIYTEHQDTVHSSAWSPNGRVLATGSADRSVKLLDWRHGKVLQTLSEVPGFVFRVAWAPDGGFLAAGAGGTICIWDASEWRLRHRLTAHRAGIHDLCWCPNSDLIASCADRDPTIGIWSAESGKQIRLLQGHTDAVKGLSFSSDGRLLASKSHDGTLQVWRCDTWEIVASVQESRSASWRLGVAFHPHEPVLATLEDGSGVVNLWELDVDRLLGTPAASRTVYYRSAKLVLVGDTGVGKTGIATVLAGSQYVPTDSTHNRDVWVLSHEQLRLPDGKEEVREIMMWDLAGQPGYRLVHQLHLKDVSTAVLVFDSRSEVDPFAGVDHWIRALRQAERLSGESFRVRRVLVAAREDRGGISVSRERMDDFVRANGIDRYVETSAKEGWGIEELGTVIRGLIDWDQVQQISSSDFLQLIQDFVRTQEAGDRILFPMGDLYRAFLADQEIPNTEEARAQFQGGIGCLAARDLVRRFSFGDLVLLRPALLDSYASSLVNAAKSEPDGLGTISEEVARNGAFRMPSDQRIQDRGVEKLLLIATIQDLLHHEVALREHAGDGSYLVFPSQFRREYHLFPHPTGNTCNFTFEGPVLNIYATLAVRLSHSEVFVRDSMWKNAVIFRAMVGGTCGLYMREVDEGRGSIVLFFNDEATRDTRFQFQEYVRVHLERRALPPVQMWWSYTCVGCGERFTDRQIQNRRERGFYSITCPVCDAVTPLDRSASPSNLSLVTAIDQAADKQRERDAAVSSLQGKVETGTFDVFLCHNGDDKEAVKRIAEALKDRGIRPWLDEWELRPGRPWLQALETEIERIHSAAVFVGNSSVGPWQRAELDAILREFVRRDVPVIPVLLEDAPHEPKLPLFLNGLTWVDFRRMSPDPLSNLVWGITGQRVE